MSRYNERIAQGLCARCGNETLVTKTMGEECRQKALDYAAKKRAEAPVSKPTILARIKAWFVNEWAKPARAWR